MFRWRTAGQISPLSRAQESEKTEPPSAGVQTIAHGDSVSFLPPQLSGGFGGGESCSPLAVTIKKAFIDALKITGDRREAQHYSRNTKITAVILPHLKTATG